jgi:hypothetical protein
MYTPLKYQGGSDNWKESCECGAQDEGGERIVACGICEVWQHRKCCGLQTQIGRLTNVEFEGGC